jgi:hypothetical protein
MKDTPGKPTKSKPAEKKKLPTIFPSLALRPEARPYQTYNELDERSLKIFGKPYSFLVEAAKSGDKKAMAKLIAINTEFHVRDDLKEQLGQKWFENYVAANKGDEELPHLIADALVKEIKIRMTGRTPRRQNKELLEFIARNWGRWDRVEKLTNEEIFRECQKERLFPKSYKFDSFKRDILRRWKLRHD